ncbi:MAG TPA: FMN-binding negative transcriptional regulator [Fimbriimonadaceae bacterium]|nr:FMN-binding negative transcriptional regulator [Fimbriimonadaceae bacterium]
MYTPNHFKESDQAVMQALIRERPLATLVANGEGGLFANHIPLLLEPERGEHGTLIGHVARANPVWKEAAGSEVLAIFHGPEAYISPNWYATKAETGRVVPTWNYAVVHAHGHLTVHDDPAWVRALVERLTIEHESAQPAPWAVTDAPADYIEKLVGAIVGIEIVIDRLEGKWKVSQNQPESNRAGVVKSLREANLEMAELVKSRLGRAPASPAPQN